MARPPGRCIFCESGGLTKEHVLPDWLKVLFPRALTSRHTFGVVEPSVVADHVGLQQHQRQGHSGTVKVRVVCKGCNNGWLSGLENRAKPLLERIILRERCRLEPEDLVILATWAAKTAMTAECKQPRPDGTTPDERTFLMQKLRPPPHWFVWVAAYNGTGWSELTMFQSRGNLRKFPVAQSNADAHYIQATTFGMRHVIFHVVGTTCPESEIRFRSRENGGLVKLWPSYPRSVLWPPHTILSDREVTKEAHILNWTFDNSLNPLARWEFTP